MKLYAQHCMTMQREYSISARRGPAERDPPPLLAVICRWHVRTRFPRLSPTPSTSPSGVDGVGDRSIQVVGVGDRSIRVDGVGDIRSGGKAPPPDDASVTRATVECGR